MTQPTVIIVIEVPRSEKTALALINLVSAALAPKVSQAQLDTLNAEINRNTEELENALKSVAPKTKPSKRRM